MKIPAIGWAVIDKGGEIDVGSVSPTRRGALVNWLWNQGVKVMNSWTDAEIERAFDGVSRALGAKVIEVKIEAAKGLA